MNQLIIIVFVIAVGVTNTAPALGMGRVQPAFVNTTAGKPDLRETLRQVNPGGRQRP